MTKWDDRVAAHDAVRLLTELETTLEGLESKDASEAEDLERLKRVTSHLRGVVDNVDAQLLTLEALNNLASPLQSIATSIQAWVDEEDGQYLAQANTYADQALNVAVPVSLGAASDGEGLRRSAESFRRSAGQLVRGLSDDVDASKAHLLESRDELSAEMEKLQSSVGEINTRLQQQQETVDKQSASQAQEFQTAQQERSALFEKGIAGQTAEFDKALAAAIEKSEQGVAALGVRGTAIVEEMEEQKDKAEKLLDAIGRTGTEFGFKEYAETEKGEANRWRWVAVASLVAIVGIGFWVLVSAHRAVEIDLSLSLLKLVVTLPLGALAAYAGRQSHQHRQNETATRMLHLDIAAIDPYIALLPEGEQHLIKAEMARRIFGHRINVAGDKSAGAVTIADQALREVLDRIGVSGEGAKGAA
jgi:hypothetical protein